MESIRVVIKKGEESTEATFNDCLLDTLCVSEDQHQISVRVTFQNNCLTISNLSFDGVNPDQESYVAVLKHSMRCPYREMRMKRIPFTDASDTNVIRNIKIGAAVLIQSSDNFVLLTKRPNHMRTYPGSWVPPGGHVDPHESLREAAAREITEEIGLEIGDSNSTFKVLALWEAAYPPILEWGFPNRHHFILYFNFIANETREQLQHKIKLDPKEVCASVWLNPLQVSALLKATDATSLQNSFPNCEATVINEDGVQSIQEFPSTDLFSFDSFEGRITVGTKFALEEWLKENENICREIRRGEQRLSVL